MAVALELPWATAWQLKESGDARAFGDVRHRGGLGMLVVGADGKADRVRGEPNRNECDGEGCEGCRVAAWRTRLHPDCNEEDRKDVRHQPHIRISGFEYQVWEQGEDCEQSQSR